MTRIGILWLLHCWNIGEGFTQTHVNRRKFRLTASSRLQDTRPPAGEQLSFESEEDEEDATRTPGIFRAVRATSTRLSEIASKGSSDVRSAASAATSGIVGIASKGSSDMRTVASTAASGLKGLAEKGASDALSVASLAEQGATNAGETLLWMDAQAKDSAGAATTKVQSLVLRFTGKSQYQFGDLSKELLRRVASAEYNLSDLMLLFKVLLAVGVSIAPVTMTLPASVLLEMLNVSLEQRLGGKLVETLASSVDARITAAFTVDDKQQLGDFAKRTLAESILKFTGKVSYEEGDIKRAVETEEEKILNCENQQSNSSSSISSNSTPKRLELPTDDADFDEWDRLFRERYPGFQLAVTESLELATVSNKSQGTPMDGSLRTQDLDKKIANELEEWDRMFKEKYPD